MWPGTWCTYRRSQYERYSLAVTSDGKVGPSGVVLRPLSGPGGDNVRSRYSLQFDTVRQKALSRDLVKHYNTTLHSNTRRTRPAFSLYRAPRPLALRARSKKGCLIKFSQPSPKPSSPPGVLREPGVFDTSSDTLRSRHMSGRTHRAAFTRDPGLMECGATDGPTIL